MIGPAPILALLIGILTTSIYVLIRGSAGGQLPLLLIAAFLGAWAGDAIGARLGLDLLVLGDFRIVAAVIVSCIGIAFVSIISILGPTKRNAGP
jgi:hypothetical protein